MFRKIARKIGVGKVLLWMKQTRLIIIQRIKSPLRRLRSQIVRSCYSHGIGLTPSLRYFLRLKNAYKGQRVFLLGNGPSLKVHDLDSLKGEICFAANKIYLSFDQTEWRPSFYFVEDDLVLKQNWEQIEALGCCPKFLPRRALEWAQQITEAHYYDFFWENPEKETFPTFGEDPFGGFYWGSTVMYSMLQFAAFMGFEEVYLLGVDFNFALPSTPAEGIQLISEGEVNHFHQDYRKPGERWNIPNLDIQLKSFRKADTVANERGFRIYNATRGGKLEVFERIDFESLIAGDA
jgi:hypothetical protein